MRTETSLIKYLSISLMKKDTCTAGDGWCRDRAMLRWANSEIRAQLSLLTVPLNPDRADGCGGCWAFALSVGAFGL